jgi:hypothetical protein
VRLPRHPDRPAPPCPTAVCPGPTVGAPGRVAEASDRSHRPSFRPSLGPGARTGSALSAGARHTRGMGSCDLDLGPATSAHRRTAPRGSGMSPAMRRARGGGTRRLPGQAGEGLANPEDAANVVRRRGQDRYAEEPPPRGHTARHRHPTEDSEASAAATSVPRGDIRHSDLTGPGRHRPRNTAGPAVDSRRRLVAGPRRGGTRGRPRLAGQRQTRPSSCRRARRRSTGRCAGSRR